MVHLLRGRHQLAFTQLQKAGAKKKRKQKKHTKEQKKFAKKE